MDPRLLFPWLALAFAVAAAWRFWRTGRWRGAPLTWAVMAAIFAGVAGWLRHAGG